ncbi:sugar kinase [Azospirillum sp. ST 5-10]|uniref:sugar kinase n=1 Tax=unclassified Azospirillum TaxID=2630922 RepID=UPI003F4A49A6
MAGKRVAVIGECMLEIVDLGAQGGSGEARFGFGGDTFNTAVYLVREGVAADYLTDLGDDPYSDWLLERWRAEGVGTRFVGRRPGGRPGLYIIRTDERGERRFFYWRDSAAVRRMLDDGTDRLVAGLAGAAVVYLSGITLSLFDERRRADLMDALAQARGHGAWIAFDTNYRPAGWPSAAAAGDAMAALFAACDVALPSLEDMQALYGDATPESALDRLASFGVAEAVVKAGEDGCLVRGAYGGLRAVPVPERIVPVDTTAAGDSFNAAYIAARLRGLPPAEAALHGHRLAGQVIRHRGAIVPKDR